VKLLAFSAGVSVGAFVVGGLIVLGGWRAKCALELLFDHAVAGPKASKS
jgi:hypothetical protein